MARVPRASHEAGEPQHRAAGLECARGGRSEASSAPRGAPAPGGPSVTCTTRACGLAGTPTRLCGSLGLRRETLSLPPAAKRGGWGSGGGGGSCGVPFHACSRHHKSLLPHSVLLGSSSSLPDHPSSPPEARSRRRRLRRELPFAGEWCCSPCPPPPGCEREGTLHAERGCARRNHHDCMCSRLGGKCQIAEKWSVPAGRIPGTE